MSFSSNSTFKHKKYGPAKVNVDIAKRNQRQELTVTIPVSTEWRGAMRHIGEEITVMSTPFRVYPCSLVLDNL
ncbi:hypothetical protein ENUP19_0366G0003 [Entamoeba nuttalli]|uniref:Uncharacterized protein n=1 Tax=Entamoeba nuttalli TaxID=412467 RepID=A0ABQ0DYM0_9EUKA